MASKRMVELKLTAPLSGIAKLRVRVGESFPVTASVLADHIGLCTVFLRFDDLALEEITRHPNPWTFLGPSVREQVQWELRGKKAMTETSVRVNAEGNGLPQLSEFAVEVTQ